MLHGTIVNWIVGACTCLRLSQRKTLGELVFGAMQCRRVSIAEIGRSLHVDALPKHCIKRTYRFLRNARVEATEACAALVMLAARRAKGHLFVAVDWTDVREYKVLKASVPLGGRSVPILFAAYRKWEVFKSQNAFEEGFFRLLKALLPPRCHVVVLADAGFARTELMRTLQELGLSYVIRVRLSVWFASDRYCGRLDDLPIRPRSHKDLGFGRYRKSKPVEQRIIFWWKPKHKEGWFLGTDLDWGWRKVCAAYGLRMQIEELFRDHKNLRYGWGLRHIQLSEPERLERLLLVLAFAYLCLLLMGVLSHQRFPESHWAAATSKNKRQASAFFIGRLMQHRHRFRLKELLQLLAAQLALIIEQNWG
jgi:hypothetical protein